MLPKDLLKEVRAAFTVTDYARLLNLLARARAIALAEVAAVAHAGSEDRGVELPRPADADGRLVHAAPDRATAREDGTEGRGSAGAAARATGRHHHGNACGEAADGDNGERDGGERDGGDRAGLAARVLAAELTKLFATPASRRPLLCRLEPIMSPAVRAHMRQAAAADGGCASDGGGATGDAGGSASIADGGPNRNLARTPAAAARAPVGKPPAEPAPHNGGSARAGPSAAAARGAPTTHEQFLKSAKAALDEARYKELKGSLLTLVQLKPSGTPAAATGAGAAAAAGGGGGPGATDDAGAQLRLLLVLSADQPSLRQGLGQIVPRRFRAQLSALQAAGGADEDGSPRAAGARRPRPSIEYEPRCNSDGAGGTQNDGRKRPALLPRDSGTE
jgi:hypothetical protein